MRVTMHQPEHLPWLGFLHKMAHADLYVLMDNVQYRHRYFQNRNRILGAAGPIWVTVPVRYESHRYGPICDIHIDNSRDWRRSYWGSIEHHYGSHPFFDAYGPQFREIVMAPFESLCDLNFVLIDLFREAFGITTPMVRSSALESSGSKGDLILSICESIGATTYISGPFGRDYLQVDTFTEAGIAVEFHDFHHPVYHQKGENHFTENLSALDLLMNYGPLAADLLLGVQPAALQTSVPRPQEVGR